MEEEAGGWAGGRTGEPASEQVGGLARGTAGGRTGGPGWFHAPDTINNPTSSCGLADARTDGDWTMKRASGPAGGPASDGAGWPASGPAGRRTGGLGWFHAPDTINNPTSSCGLADGRTDG